MPRKNLIIAQIHKSAKGMLLQYSGSALVRDADIVSTSLVGMIDQVHKTHLATDSHVVTLENGLSLFSNGYDCRSSVFNDQ